MGGLFVPDTYVHVAPSDIEMNVASMIWGVSIGFAVFTFSKGVRQTWGIWKRTRTVTAYVALIWIEWLVCFLLSPILWFYIWGSIEPSFALFVIILILWTLQIQCIIQIIINRIALLKRDRTRIRQLQWSSVLIIGLINISVFCIWIPAQLQISGTYITINYYWDRIEKAIFAIVDVSLNVYFVRLIRSKLISNGLTKYYPLFYFNCAMISVSITLDVILIASMSIGTGFVYSLFHPAVYGIKLYIELNMADLITKSVQGDNGSGAASGSGGNVYHNSSGAKQDKSGKGRGARSYWGGPGASGGDDKITAVRMKTLVTANGAGTTNSQDQEQGGIRRKVETEVVHEPKDEDAQSRTSSTEQLQKKFGIV
ncbi:uncharacterized protein B0I36DRAFT_434744 [Microdochium trichocladiopsis]|uniref:Uncharacterized protein n=1 Tax=Microdochium trichocladiopsis TaxID=1682393 RepID=A0A9P8XV44_9PEZI|nr:uncharacterized protein B0I36DRAFT_434744 [Microdochium trichocladiopsis]KAH7020748.1 hypothetical protein B0I36DRAFT_434744 [Microdochium trichocladiopsis]